MVHSSLRVERGRGQVPRQSSKTFAGYLEGETVAASLQDIDYPDRDLVKHISDLSVRSRSRTMTSWLSVLASLGSPACLCGFACWVGGWDIWIETSKGFGSLVSLAPRDSRFCFEFHNLQFDV